MIHSKENDEMDALCIKCCKPMANRLLFCFCNIMGALK